MPGKTGWRRSRNTQLSDRSLKSYNDGQFYQKVQIYLKLEHCQKLWQDQTEKLAIKSTFQLSMNVEELKAEVETIKWFHEIDLGNGVITPGMSGVLQKGQKMLPESLEGMSVLDIGAWDGFYSFESERRGASRVLATDHYCWSGEGWGTKAGFELARKALNSKVEDKEIDVLDISPETVGIFDLVLFLGVLYHMRHPLLALERVASVTSKQIILETHVDMLDYDQPAMAFYPGAELNGDHSNWCGPNPPMVKAMLETVGFKEVKVFDSPFHHLWAPRKVFYAWR
ncbi:MAG TPA: DUF1698 domain-containing protein [Coleofasciculaceae cyanobacterium]